MKTKYLIIGGSISGVSCIEGIRQLDTEGQITLVSDEETLNYSRPLISYYLGGQIPEEKMTFKEKNFYRDNGVRVILPTRVQKIKSSQKEVSLCSGETIQFQKLLIATGGNPLVPSIEGLDAVKEGVFTFTRLQDAKDLLDYIKARDIEEAVVLGAGLIGLKCTEGLIRKGLKVTVIELADRVLANTFDCNASDILEDALEEWDCQVKKNNTVMRVENKRGRIEKVILKDGKKIPTRLMVIAIGVRPNKQLAQDTGITCEKGIIVDEHMQTSRQDIYAAGDVAQGKDFLRNRNAVLAIWPVAAHQGKIAGINMAGKKEKYRGSFIMNSVELAGVPTISFGITNPPEKDDNFEVLCIRNKKRRFYRKIVLKEDRIVGAIFLSKIERAGIFSGLIKDRIDVSSFKQELLSDEFGFLVLPAEYRKHLVQGEGIEV